MINFILWGGNLFFVGVVSLSTIALIALHQKRVRTAMQEPDWVLRNQRLHEVLIKLVQLFIALIFVSFMFSLLSHSLLPGRSILLATMVLPPLLLLVVLMDSNTQLTGRASEFGFVQRNFNWVHRWQLSLGVGLLLVLIPSALSFREIAPFVAVYAVTLTSFLFGLEIAKFFKAFVPAPDHICNLVAGQGGDPEKALVANTPMAQAWAFAGGQIAVSQGLLDNLDEVEVAAIVGHEVGHKSHLKGAVSASLIYYHVVLVLATGVSLIPSIAWLSYTVGIIGILLAKKVLGTGKISHENEADAVACEQTSNEHLGSALEKLHRYNGLAVVTKGKAKTHPDLYDRLQGLGITPSYPRPELAKFLKNRYVYMGLAGLWMFVFVGTGIAPAFAPESATAQIIEATFNDGDRSGPGTVAGVLINEGKFLEAFELLGDAEEHGFNRSIQLAAAAVSLAELGDCAGVSYSYYTEAYYAENLGDSEKRDLNDLLWDYHDICLVVEA